MTNIGIPSLFSLLRGIFGAFHHSVDVIGALIQRSSASLTSACVNLIAVSMVSLTKWSKSFRLAQV
jgi:hypothetical protein